MSISWAAGDGTVRLDPAPGRSRWTAGPWTFTHWPRTAPGGRWGCSRDGRGVAGCRTPAGAFLGLVRWRREDREP
jgi:hypothetical protein